MAFSAYHVVVGANATSTEATSTVNVKEIKLISNDGAYDITFNFDAAYNATGAFVLKVGEKIESWKIPVGVLHYYAGTSSAFRFIGTADDGKGVY